MIDTSVPVVDIFRGGYGDVSIARTLGRLGVPLYLVAQEGMRTPVWSSRYWVTKARWDFSSPEEESVAYLLRLGTHLQERYGARAILLTTADWLAIFIERNGEPLQERFEFPRSAQPVVRKLLNKWEMYRLANEHGVPTPRTVCPTSREDVEDFLRTTSFPIVMKQADPFLEASPKKILYERRELMNEIDGIAARGRMNVILQEYIPGEADTVWMCNGYFGAENSVTFTGKKLRQVSPTGIASLAICLPNETVASQTRRLMEGVGFRGCVGIGFRYDGRDGLYKLLDVNARISGLFRLFAGSNEMDVVRVCYLDLTGQRVPETTLQPGRKWMLEDDVFAAFLAVLGRRLSITEWRRSLRGVRELQWFAKDDPVPVLVWLREKIRRAAVRSFRNLRGAGRT